MGVVGHLEARGHHARAARGVQRRAARGERVLQRHPALDAGVWSALKAFAATERGRGAHRRAAALPRQDARRLPAQRRRPRRRRQGAARRDRRRARRAHAELLAERARRDQRASSSSIERRGAPRRPARAARSRPRGRARRSKGQRGLPLHAPGAELRARAHLPRRRGAPRAALPRVQHARGARASSTTARSSRASSSCAARRRRSSASRTSPISCSRIAWRRRAPRRGASSTTLRDEAERLPSSARTRSSRAFRRELEGAERARARALGRRATTPRSCAARATTSTRRRCARTSRSTRVLDGLVRDRRAPLRRARRAVGGRAGVAPRRCAPTRMREADGALRAVFYVDVFPRETKRDGAWMHGLVTGVGRGAAARAPRGARRATSRRRSAARPRCSRTARSRRMFHEFGHLLHHALEPRRRAQPGGHERGVGLRRAALADHGELVLGARGARPLRAPLRDRRAHPRGAASTRMRARAPSAPPTRMMRQLGFAEVDLALHIDYDPASDGDVDRLRARASRSATPPARCPTTTR